MSVLFSMAGCDGYARCWSGIEKPTDVIAELLCKADRPAAQRRCQHNFRLAIRRGPRGRARMFGADCWTTG